MGFPRKFKAQLETTLADIDTPDRAWLTYSVCACKPDSCGWGGWIIDGVFKTATLEESTNVDGKLLPGDYRNDCPRCGNPLFRTAASIRFIPSDDQRSQLIPEVDYRIAPMEYDD